MDNTLYRILHFENNEIDALKVERIVAGKGRAIFEIVQVEDLQSGLRTLEHERFDVVLLDLSLPDSSGVETYAAVRALAERMPIVVMTENEDADLGAELIGMGAQDYLLKSEAEGRVLLRSLRHAIERSHIESELREARTDALDAARTKSDLLSSMSHEIRTPLNAILGMTNLLEETALDTEQQRFVSMVRSSGDMLLEVIDAILDVSKAEAGQLVLDCEPFEPRVLVEQTLEALAYSAHRKGLAFVCDISDDVPRVVVGDPRRLRQILVNLIGNAIKFTERGEVVVEVNADANPADSSRLQFSVIDTGIGIAPEHRERIFERFSQADDAITRRFGGTGLGLSLCATLVGLMQGRIWVESIPEEGSTFFFTACFERGRVPVCDTQAETGTAPTGCRVLIADDQEVERRLLAKHLRRRGYQVEEATDGEEAVALLRAASAQARSFDAALIDCRMPVTGGFGVAHEFGAGSPERRRMIMMLNSDHRSGDIRECERLGLAGWLIKPWSHEALFAQLADLVRGEPKLALGNERHRPHVAQKEKPMRDLRILLADDSEDNRALIRMYLKRTPYSIVEVTNGQQAIDLWKESHFDLVLMDMRMPQVDGYRATRAIRRIEEIRGLAATPILALTAYAFMDERQKSLDAGCDAHLTKPIQKAVLLAAIDLHADTPPIVVTVDEDLRELALAYLENRQGDVATLDRALAEGDFETVEVLGHDLKGAGRSYGFDGLTEIGEVLERAGEARHGPEVEKQVRALEDYLDRVRLSAMTPLR